MTLIFVTRIRPELPTLFHVLSEGLFHFAGTHFASAFARIAIVANCGYSKSGPAQKPWTHSDLCFGPGVETQTPGIFKLKDVTNEPV